MNTAVKEVHVIKATKTGEKTEKIRVAAYCRVSTDKDDQLNSFFAQMMYYRDYVRGNDKMVLVDTLRNIICLRRLMFFYRRIN